MNMLIIFAPMRLFIAVDLSDELRERFNPIISALGRFNVKTVELKNLHITLKFLGEVSERMLPLIDGKLREIEFSPFKIKFKGVGYFPNEKNPRVVWVGVEGEELRKLAEEVEQRMKRLGFKKDKDFHPHLTVGRIKRLDKSERGRLVREMEAFNTEWGEMVVDRFKLKKSTLTPKGPIYEDVFVYEAGGGN